MGYRKKHKKIGILTITRLILNLFLFLYIIVTMICVIDNKKSYKYITLLSINITKLQAFKIVNLLLKV